MDLIEAGQTYRYGAQATDPEGQALAYSLVAGPQGAALDSDSGHMTWSTAAEHVGSHNVTLRATDPYGLFAEQSFAVQVVDSLQNRPPNFVSDPITEAIASSGFEITTVGTGENPQGVAVISGFQGPRLVTINAGEQTVGVYAGENNDRFDDATVYSTGEPRPTGDPIAGGYRVDVNLPPRRTSGDLNDVLGLDQGDLNGDGILDLVAMTFFRDASPSRSTDRYQIVAALGDGNGNFSQPIEIVTFPEFNNSKYRNLILTDINNDDSLDITLLRRRGSETTLLTLLGNGDGTFAALSEDITNSTEEGKIPLNDFRFADLDHDGKLDIVGRDPGTTQIGWRPGNGDGTFESFVTIYEFGASFVSLLDRPYDIADIDLDGDLDVVVGETGSTTVLLNDGNQSFSKIADLDGRNPRVISIADFTGDGQPDIFIGLGSEEGLLYVGDSAATSFTDSGQIVPLNIWPSNPAGTDEPVDVDRDGDLDLVLGSGLESLTNSRENQAVLYLENLSDGVFQPHEYAPTGLGDAAGVLVGDYNGDGINDLAHYTTDSSFNSVGILPGTRPGEFAGVGESDVPAGTLGSVVVNDFDGDGNLDYLLPGLSQTRLGRGDGTFGEPIPAYSLVLPGVLGRTADFNADGVPDLLTWNGRAGGGGGGSTYAVLLGIGNGTFEVGFNASTELFYSPLDYEVFDFNNDGLLDFLMRSSTDFNGIDVFLNDATDPGNNFIMSQRILLEGRGFNAFGFALSNAVADFDEDGVLDLVIHEKTPEEPSVKLQALRGNGDGTFTVVNEQFDYPDLDLTNRMLNIPYVLKTGDINNDSHSDLVLFTHKDLRVQLGNGDLTFTRR